MKRDGQPKLTVGPPKAPPAGHDQLIERIDAFPRQRTYLLPALLAVQHDIGWLPDWAIERVGAHLRVPKSEAYGAASSYPELRLTEPAERVVRICTGSACRAAGARALRQAMRDFPGEVQETDCLFICGLAPAAQLDGQLIGRATPERLDA